MSDPIAVINVYANGEPCRWDEYDTEYRSLWAIVNGLVCTIEATRFEDWAHPISGGNPIQLQSDTMVQEIRMEQRNG